MRGTPPMPQTTEKMREVQRMVVEGVRHHRLAEMVRALRVLYLEHSLYPEDPSTNIQCFEGQVGSLLLASLGHAVQTGYIEGVIVLFEEKRAQHLLECVRAETPQEHETIHLVQKILCLTQDNTNGLRDCYTEMLDCDKPFNPSSSIETILAVVLNQTLHDQIDQQKTAPRFSSSKKI